jgi:hypothetical protein
MVQPRLAPATRCGDAPGVRVGNQMPRAVVGARPPQGPHRCNIAVAPQHRGREGARRQARANKRVRL